ncbi:MAG: TonB-dependent receptor [Acidaminococcaceae bacterium]|nr:TonB-dependent receptor [Acidaminococcaceae bacterium]
MLSRKITAAILLACAASLPVYAENTGAAAGSAAAADAHTATQQEKVLPSNKTAAHSAVTQTNFTQTPASTTVITAEEMADNHYETVAEALSYAPGVTVTPGSLNTAHQVVRIDGDDRVAVFIDGRKQNLESGFSDGRATYDLDMTPPVMAIDKIEILHGASGGNFLNYDTPGGIINIITKKGTDHNFKFEAARGPYDAWRWNTQLEGSGKGWSWIGTGGRSNLEELRFKNVDGNKETMPNSRVNRREMYYRIDRQLTKNSSLNFTYGHFSNDRGLWYSRTNPTDYNYEKMANHLALTYNYKENSPLPGYVSLYHYYNQGDTYRPTGTKDQEDLLSYGRWKTNTNGIDWRDGWQINKNRSISAGVSWRHTSVDSETNYNVAGNPDPGALVPGYPGVDNPNRSFGKNYEKSNSNLTAFIKTARQIKKLTLTSTRGITHNSRFGSHYISSSNGEYRPTEKTTLYGNIQHFYAIPTLDELYYNNQRIQGNPNLDPERGWKASGGIRHQFSKKISGDISGFLSYTKNPILWNYNPGAEQWRPDNYEGLHQQGIQLTLTGAFSPKYNATLSYAYTNSSTDWGDKDPSYTDLVARHQVKAALRYKDSRWSNNILLTSGFGRDSNWYSGNYFVVDVNLGYKFSKHWSSYLKIHNLFNDSYESLGSRTMGDCPAYGRTALFGVVYSYK